jgi:phospholipid transport system substrate-binding protein
MKKLFSLSSLLASVFLLAVEGAPDAVFSGEALRIKEQLVELFDASRKVNGSPADKKASREKIEAAMDWEQVAKDCLGPVEWKKASASNRATYQDLLRDVVVKTAFTRLDTFWDGASYQFTKIDVKGSRAKASVTYKVKAETFELEYSLLRRGKQWAVYDIAFEGMLYSENIREQITAFLKEKGFASLIDKLKKRREELDASNPAAKKN